MDDKKKKRTGRPRLLKNWTAALLRDRAREYFEKCDNRVKRQFTKDGVLDVPNPAPYSIEGLCDYLDILRWQFDAWRKLDSDIGERAKKIHQKIIADRVAGALDGTQNPAFARFMLTNNNPEHYREKVEVEQSVSGEYADILERSLAKWNVH